MKYISVFSHIIIGSLILPFLVHAQDDYYTIIGGAKNAPMQEIRRLCTAKLTEAKKLEEEKNKAQQDVDAAKAAGKPTDQLAAKVTDIQQKITTIQQACGTLQDLTKKAAYDKTLSEAAGVQAAKQQQIDEAKKYCDTAAALGAQKQKLEQELNAQGTEFSVKQEIQSDLTEINKKIAAIERDCKILADYTNPAFQTTLVRIREEQKQEAIEDTGVFGSIKKGVREAKKDADVKIVSLVGNLLSSIPIPDAAGRVFNQNIAMRNLRFKPVPSGPNIRKGMGFTGTLNFNNFTVKGTMFVIEDTSRKIQCSFSLELPENYKISSMFSQFTKLDVLSLPQGKFVISSFEYTDPDGYGIQAGFNFVSRLDLSGPLKALDDLMKKAKQLKSVVARIEPIHFQGVIPRDITKTSLSAIIPLRFGIDFTKIPNMPKTVTDIFKEFTTDDLVFAISAPPKVTFSFEGGVRLVLGTQADPIRLSMLGVIEPTSFSLGIRMRNMLELKFIALGNAGVQLDFDESLMAAAIILGIPFTGIGVNGEVDLGTNGPSRVVMKVAGGMRVSASSIPDIVLQVEATNLNFANIINLVSKVVAKTGAARELPADKIPVMNIDRVSGYLVLEDTKIAGKTYDAGFGLTLNAQLFDKKFGFSFDVKHKQLTAAGNGYVSPIDVTIKGKRIFSLTGPGLAGVTEAGPVVYCDFNFSNAQELAKGTFGVKALMEIPPVDFKNKVDLEIKNKAFRADVEASYAGFTALFGINIDPEKWKEMVVKFGFKGDFEKFLSEQAMPILLELQKEATEKLAQVDKKIGDLSTEASKLQTQGVSDTQKEINKTKGRISALERRIAALRRECDSATITQKITVCPRVGTDLIAPGAELAAQKTYLEGLLKPGQEVVKGVTGVLASATRAVADAKLFQKTVSGFLTGITQAVDGIGKGLSIFKVTEAMGLFSAKDLSDGKLPQLIILVAEVNIPNLPKVRVELRSLQFDFKNPKPSALAIARKLLSGVKLG